MAGEGLLAAFGFIPKGRPPEKPKSSSPDDIAAWTKQVKSWDDKQAATKAAQAARARAALEHAATGGPMPEALRGVFRIRS